MLLFELGWTSAFDDSNEVYVEEFVFRYRPSLPIELIQFFIATAAIMVMFYGLKKEHARYLIPHMAWQVIKVILYNNLRDRPCFKENLYEH